MKNAISLVIDCTFDNKSEELRRAPEFPQDFEWDNFDGTFDCLARDILPSTGLTYLEFEAILRQYCRECRLCVF